MTIKRKTYYTDGALPVTVREVLHRWMQAVHVVNKRTEIAQDYISTILTNTAVCLVVVFFRSVSFLRQTLSSLKHPDKTHSAFMQNHKNKQVVLHCRELPFDKLPAQSRHYCRPTPKVW